MQVKSTKIIKQPLNNENDAKNIPTDLFAGVLIDYYQFFT